MATHRGEALKMIPVMVDDEPFMRAYRNVKINFQPLLASEAVAISDGQNFMSKTASFSCNQSSETASSWSLKSGSLWVMQFCWFSVFSFITHWLLFHGK